MSDTPRNKVDRSAVDFAATERGALGVDIPEGVYYRQTSDNFYSTEGNGMGCDFYRKWFTHRWLFPQKGWGIP